MIESTKMPKVVSNFNEITDEFINQSLTRRRMGQVEWVHKMKGISIKNRAKTNNQKRAGKPSKLN